MNILAIIPARGGSKGIPRKNLRLLEGKPLVAHAIETARQARLLTRVVVSTDDFEIADVAKLFGAEVVMRPAEISGDMASSESALLHTLEQFEQRENYHPDLLVFLQCTSPLTLPEDIDGVIHALQEGPADSALAVTPFHYFLWLHDENGEAIGVNHNKLIRPLRQKRDPQFLETGAVYAMRTDGFKQAKHRFFGNTTLYVMPPERCLEIDEPHDLLMAEIILRERQKQKRSSLLPARITAVVFDFDGVFTDNHVLVLQDGREAVRCDRGDGQGIAELKRLGLPILVLSTEGNPVVSARCNKLGIVCRQGVKEKLSALMSWLNENHLRPADVVYVGNDLNDLSCLQAVGCGVATSDAYPEAKAAARIVLSSPGGSGAVREIIELILHSAFQ